MVESEGAGWLVATSMTPSGTRSALGNLRHQSPPASGQRPRQRWALPMQSYGGGGRGAGRHRAAGTDPTSSSSRPFLMAQSV